MKLAKSWEPAGGTLTGGVVAFEDQKKEQGRVI